MYLGLSGTLRHCRRLDVTHAPNGDYNMTRTDFHRSQTRSIAAIGLLGGLLLGRPALAAASRSGPRAVNSAMADSTTTVIILGVDHSAQLGAREYHAGYFRAFFDRVKPTAICVERSPDEFARGEFYEFTYEAQVVAVPYAHTHHLDICPIDWLPSRDDERLAFGRLDVVDPPMVRPAAGFQAFLTLDSSSLRRTLFFADSEPSRQEARAFFDAPRAPGSRDFPRRLDLYRTYMQAMRIVAAVQAHRGGTLLVVVGATHKDDLERILGASTAIRIVQPSTIGLPAPGAIESALSQTDLGAILSFNLLGVQSLSKNVDWPWVAAILKRFATQVGDSPELELFRIRFAVLHDNLRASDAAARYERLARSASATDRFTFDAAVDRRRIDTYFDPFGNFAVRDRALLEAAREWRRAGMPDRGGAIRADLLQSGTWTPLKRAEFDEYWDRYILQ